MSLLLRSGLRHLARHRLQCALAISGIALGVAIVVGIQAVQQSARDAFERSLDTLFGQSSHFVSAGSDLLDEDLLATVRRIAPHWRPAPVVNGRVRLADDSAGARLPLMGMDPLNPPARTPGAATFDVSRLMLEPGAAAVGRTTAARLGLAPGMTLALERGALHVIAVLDDAGAGAVLRDMLIVDIATAQEILGLAGRLSRIELDQGDRGDAARVLAALADALPAAVTVSESARNRHGARELTRAFYTNLDALSLLALLVGAFMIYNTLFFLVMQRERLFARLRAIGVPRAAIGWQVAVEAAVLGLAGGALGNLLGFALAAALMEPMSLTLSDHYFDGTLQRAGFSPTLCAAGFALALVTALASALVPALHAASSAPAALERGAARALDANRLLRGCALLGAAFGVLGAALLLFSSRSLYAGFGALGAFLLAATLMVPRVVQILLNLLDRRAAARLPLAERLAVRGASRALGRIGMAIAALMAATATSIGIGLMVDSFRGAVGDWLDQLLRADFYLSQDLDDGLPPVLDPALMASLAARPEIAALSKVRRIAVRMDGRAVRVTAYDLPPAARTGFRFVAGTAEQVWAHWDEDTVIVSEPFAWHHRVAPGDVLELPTPSGARRMEVRGIYTDYGSEHGVIALSWTSYARAWHDQRAHGIGIYSAPGAAADAVSRILQDVAARHGTLEVWPNAAIRRESLAVFDRTFAITDVLTLFAALIAALGVFNALLALNLERTREYAVMRATGCGRALIRRVLHGQTAIVALVAIACAVPLGAAIAVLLIEVINVRSFGWSMPFTPSAASVVQPCLLALGAALLATVYPAERAVRCEPATALRNE